MSEEGYEAEDFYFALYEDSEEYVDEDGPMGIAVITLKSLWDAEQLWSDQCEEGDLVPDVFYQRQEAEYEFDVSMVEARRLLIEAGFEENREILDI